ncbi:MAG: hypothetical protein IJU65_08065 [Desulfovibrio sp.]|nr:hypothetical protein [Desulfovibrio sp.]
MTYFEPMSGVTLYVTPNAGDDSGFITYYPSIMSDITAATEQLMSQDSCTSFNQTQFRMAAENMIGLGAIASDWA